MLAICVLQCFDDAFQSVDQDRVVVVLAFDVARHGSVVRRPDDHERGGVLVEVVQCLLHCCAFRLEHLCSPFFELGVVVVEEMQG